MSGFEVVPQQLLRAARQLEALVDPTLACGRDELLHGVQLGLPGSSSARAAAQCDVGFTRVTQMLSRGVAEQAQGLVAAATAYQRTDAVDADQLRRAGSALAQPAVRGPLTGSPW